MFTDSYSFPHPVLGISDDISGEFNAAIEVERNAKIRAIKFFNIKYNITNDYIKSLIDNGEAGLLVKVYCSSTYKTWSFFEPGEYFEINENDLFNKVDIQLLIVANKAIPNYQHNSFNPQFSGYIFNVNEKEVLAISGNLTLMIEKINEKLGLGNIFKFFSIDPGKPIHFTYNQNKIYIMYPVDGKGNHPPSRLFKIFPWSAYNMFILPALTGAFEFATKEKSEAENYEWYTVITNFFPEDMWDSDPYVNAQLLLQKGIPIINAFTELTK